MSKWFHGFFRRAPTRVWRPVLRISGTEFFARRMTPMRERAIARYQRRARELRQTGDEHDHKMALKLLRGCKA